ncbi:hypothetical protein F4778DRAFT_745970 [Xylariomycetidae sp. FL2044]|nr:hypothetical protein F4778DRAFT_745970 [Xylariomycetidae sp. FL2044]
MVITSACSSQRIYVLLVASVLVLLFVLSDGPRSPLLKSATPKMSDSVPSKLKVTVRQTSTSPPKIAIGVTNTDSDPVTILTYNSPLDPLAVQLGLLTFTPESSENPIDIPTIQVRRKMPPGPESLVTIEPDQTQEQELELKAPVVPLDKLRGHVQVVCRGDWMSIWRSTAEDISESSLKDAGAGEDAFRGSFESQEVDVEI